MLHQLKSYLTFLLRSTNQHGVHSPFVYDLVTRCFYDKEIYLNTSILTLHRTKLLKDTSAVSVTDFGAGSRVFKSNKRTVKAMAKKAGITPKRQHLLRRLVFYFQPKKMLELGTSLGMATMAMAAGRPTGNITTVEGCPETLYKAQQYFKDFGITNVTAEISTFEDFFQKNQNKIFDFVYVDGNHSKQSTLTYFEHLLEMIHDDSIIIFDDIYWSADMTEAWKEIIAHPKVTVSIDTFQWGIVFFRKEQQKEHFTIRV